MALIGWSGGEEQKKLSRNDKLMLILCVAGSTLLWGLLGIFEKRALEFGRPFETSLATASVLENRAGRPHLDLLQEVRLPDSFPHSRRLEILLAVGGGYHRR